MRLAIRVLALTAIGAAAFVPAAHAQDMTTATFNGTTIWVGGGVQFLSASRHPVHRQGHQRRQTCTARRTARATGWISAARRRRHRDGARHVGRLARERQRQRLLGQCRDRRPLRPATGQTASSSIPTGNTFAFGPPTLVTQTNRDADYWGGQAELKFGRPAAGTRDQADYLPQRLFHRRRRRSRHRPGQQPSRQVRRPLDLHLQGDPRYHLCRRLYRLRRRIQLRLHPVMAP